MEKGTIPLDLKERPNSQLPDETLPLISPLCKMETLPLARLTCNVTCGLPQKAKGQGVTVMWGDNPKIH